MIANDTLDQVLFIDLARREFKVEHHPELFQERLGGAGVAIRLLSQHCPPGCDPLGPDNPIIMAVGPLTGFFPLASKTVAMFKSPHTGNLGESHCGGRSAVAIRLAGYGALVITGRSEIPVYISIHDGRVFFHDARTLWGMGTNATAGRIIREREKGAGMRSIMRIGKAGENLVTYACVTTETYRHFGRLGLGAVFGSKNLKAVVVYGNRSFVLDNRRGYRELYEEIYKTVTTSPVMKKYHDLGTAENILPLNSIAALPTRNLKEAVFSEAEAVSGEAFASAHLARRLACAHCPVGCIHLASLREPYEDEPYFYKTSMVGYDYEPIFSLGSMLGIGDATGLLKLIERVEAVGLDVMSTGVVLAWATEAFATGLVSDALTGGIHPAWGDYGAYCRMVEAIAARQGEFYDALARGVVYASGKYGGREFAMAHGGNEMPGYHTGPGAHLGFAAGARHSHLDNAGYSLDQKMLKEGLATPQALAEKIVAEERWRQVLASLAVCFFARGVYQPDLVRRALAITGFALGLEELNCLGTQIHRDKFDFKAREGFDFDHCQPPARIFETPAALGRIDPAYFGQAMAEIKKLVKAE